MLTTELWISFTSLLRSYVAAAGLDSGSPADVRETGDSIAVALGGARLEMRYEPASGEGNWRLRGSAEEVQGRFALLPEGRFSLDGTVLDLDHAAIDFAAALKQAGLER